MKKGFSLIELMVVIAIIGFLAAITIPRFMDLTSDAKIANVQSNLVNIRTMIDMYQVKNGDLPDLEMEKEDGDLGGAEKYLNKNVLPKTPVYKGVFKYGWGEKKFSVEETNKISKVEAFGLDGFNGDGNGGWCYIKATKAELEDPWGGKYFRKHNGQIKVNLTHGTYGTDFDWGRY